MAIKRLYDTLVGATVNVNQLVDADTSSVTIKSGHKYYAKISGTESIGSSTGTAISVTGGTDMVIDLTAMFGSTIADYLYTIETATTGAGIAKLREWGFLTGEYIPYNPGTLESVEATAHKMVGFNCWNEEWEVGGYSGATGGTWNTTDRIRSKAEDYILILPNVNYYSSSPVIIEAFFYGADKSYISHSTVGAGAVFTSPANAKYMRFFVRPAYGTTYNNDICINLSSDRNGEYEPYVSHTYDLGTDTLRGIFKLDASNNLYADGDVKTSDGTITRKYGVVDLGSFDWVVLNARFNSTTSIPSIVSVTTNLISPKYTPDMKAATRELDKSICVTNGGYIYIYDTSYSDAASFKTAMSGVMLVYPLATPTTETSTPFQNPQICDPDGTEEYITETGVPVGHETRYQL